MTASEPGSRARQIDEMYRLAGIPKRFTGLSLLDVKMVRFGAGVDVHSSYFLHGVAGSGKSFVMGALAGELINEVPPLEEFQGMGDVTSPVRWKNVVELFFDLRKTFNREGGSEDSVMSRLISCKYLFLDDLGAEKTSDWTMDRLYHVINSRYESMKHLVITSNLSLSEIQTRCHDRIASRIGEMCQVIEFPKRDLRLDKAEASRKPNASTTKGVA